MQDCCEVSYNKKYPNATVRCTISNVNSVYDPYAFAEWLTNAFKASHFKSWQEVADEVGSSRSTLSRYAGAKPQSLTGKPSQPDPDLAINLARVFSDDVDKVLLLAGHAPQNVSHSETIKLSENVHIQILDKNVFSVEDKEILKNNLALANEFTERQIAERKKQTTAILREGAGENDDKQ